MTEAMLGMIAGVSLGSGIIYFACKAKDQYTRHQRRSLMSLGIVLILGGLNRITITEGVQESDYPGYTTPIIRESLDEESDKAIPYQASYLTLKTLTEETLMKFYQTVVQPSAYDQVALILTNRKGIVFSKSKAMFEYGEWEDQPNLEKILGFGTIQNNQIHYQFH